MESLDFSVPQSVNELSSYLRLKLGNQIMLVLLNQIYMVLPILELQMVPNDDISLAGILNYHGQPVPVYHLSELINAPKPQYDLNTLLLISPLSSSLVGFLVSEEIDIIHIPENIIQDAPMYENKPFVIGLLENETWSAWILDLEKLLQFHQTEVIKSNA